MSTQVTVPRSLLAALAGVALAAVLGLVFLLGRASVHAAPTEPPRAPAAAVPGPPPPVAPAAPPTAEPGALPPASPTQAAQPPAPRQAPSLQTNPASPDDPDRPAVLAYFKAVDRIQGQSTGDPETAAGQIMAGFAKGDTSGLEGMIHEAQTARDRLAALAPPGPCAAYHRESLELLDGNLDLLRGIIRAVSAPTPPSDDFTQRATALKARTEALQAQEQALRKRYRF